MNSEVINQALGFLDVEEAIVWVIDAANQDPLIRWSGPHINWPLILTCMTVDGALLERSFPKCHAAKLEQINTT